MKKRKYLKINYMELFPNSIWKDVYINNEKTKYKVSSDGVIISFHDNKQQILSGHKMTSGYIIHCLYHNDKKYWMLEHRIVAIAHIPIPDHLKDYSYDQLEVNHIKGDFDNKSNNSVDNLEWVTSSDNKNHGYKTGLYSQGVDHYASKYTADQITNVCFLLYENKLSRMEISKITGVDDATIGMILAGKQWKSISSNFDFSNRKKKHTLYSKQVISKTLDLLKASDPEHINFSEIGRKTGMSRTSVWYLYNKHIKSQKS